MFGILGGSGYLLLHIYDMTVHKAHVALSAALASHSEHRWPVQKSAG